MSYTDVKEMILDYDQRSELTISDENLTTLLKTETAGGVYIKVGQNSTLLVYINKDRKLVKRTIPNSYFIQTVSLSTGFWLANR